MIFISRELTKVIIWTGGPFFRGLSARVEIMGNRNGGYGGEGITTEMTEILFDPELGCTTFTVERITCTRSREGTVSRSVTEQAAGCVHPGTAETLALLPEEEKQEQFIVIYTDYPLSAGASGETGVSFTAPDRIRWNGRTWRVVRVRDWQGFGYVQALAVRMRE